MGWGSIFKTGQKIIKWAIVLWEGYKRGKELQETTKGWLKSHIQKTIKTKLNQTIRESILYISIYLVLLLISINIPLYSIRLIAAILVLILYTWLTYQFFFQTIPDFRKLYKLYKSKTNKTFLTLLQLSIWEIVLEKSIISLILIMIILIFTRLAVGDFKILEPILNLFY